MKYLFCFIIGLFLGIAIMCLLQINRGLDNEENKINNWIYQIKT
jgi:hypothetical protein